MWARGREQAKRLRVNRCDLIAVLIIIALATLVCLPILIQHFPKGHDAAWHYRWTVGFINALGEGTLYPRWHTEANFGQGSPVMLYYPPLPFYVAAAFSIVVAQPITALKLACLVALSISGVTMYVFSRSFCSRPLSLIAAAFYMLAPYHLFDLYTRSALSEFWTFAWIPLLLHLARRVLMGDDLRMISYLAISYALLLLTHVPTLIAVTFILPIFALFITRERRRLIGLAAGLMLGAGLGAVYAAPVVFERKYVNIDHILGYDENFFLFRNLDFVFTSPLAASGEGPELFLTNSNWIAVGLVLLFALASLLIWSKKRPDEQSGFDASARKAIWFVTASSLIMTTSISLPLWQAVPVFSALQFPTRWLLIATAGVSVLVAAAVSVMARPSKLRFICYLSLFASVIVFNLAISALTIARAPLSERWYRARQVTNIEVIEYHPIWWDGQRHEEFEAAPVIVLSGDASISALDDKGARQSYVVSASSESVLRFRTLYFPGWVARIDDRAIKIEPSKEGNILINVEPGEHALTLSFEDTWPRTVGKLLSALSLLFAITIFLRPAWLRGRVESV